MELWSGQKAPISTKRGPQVHDRRRPGGAARARGVRRAGVGGDPGAAGVGSAHARRAAVRVRVRPGSGGAGRAGGRRVRRKRARQRARPDRLPLAAGDGERAGRRGCAGARRRARHERAGGGRQRHQRRHRVAHPGRQGGPGRPAGDRRPPDRGAGQRPRRVRQGGALPAGGTGRGAPGPGDRCAPAVADVAAAIRPETVLVACSAPSYAHGVVDPVEQIAQVAAAAGVRCHVDACFGGWTLPYLRRLGVPVPAFDFAVPGVTSISVDLHKYAYAPKGVSVLLHRDAGLRAPQYFAYADWPGYTMVNPVISSTRSGGPIAAAYATLRHLGDDGYLELTRRTWAAVRALADAVRGVDGLRLVAEPESTVVCLTSTDPDLDLFVLVDELTARGWHTQPQLAYAGLPRSVHLTVTAAVAPRVAEFGPALAEAAAGARAAGPVVLPPELLALAGSLTPEALTPELVGRAGRRARPGRSARPAGPDGGGEHPARRRPGAAAGTAVGRVRRAAATPDLVARATRSDSSRRGGPASRPAASVISGSSAGRPRCPRVPVLPGPVPAVEVDDQQTRHGRRLAPGRSGTGRCSSASRRTVSPPASRPRSRTSSTIRHRDRSPPARSPTVKSLTEAEPGHVDRTLVGHRDGDRSDPLAVGVGRVEHQLTRGQGEVGQPGVGRRTSSVRPSARTGRRSTRTSATAAVATSRGCRSRAGCRRRHPDRARRSPPRPP